MFVMRILTLVMASALSLIVPSGDDADSTEFLAMFWNLENFFDYRDGGGGASDSEFTPDGLRHWNASRFYAKCNAISKAIYWVSDRYGRLPDVVGVAEVENRDVLVRLLHSTALRKAGYSIVHYDSPDHRGIDVALLWRSEPMELMASKPCHIDGMATRDILLTRLRCRKDGREIGCAVVHLPSKYGGGKTSQKRKKAAERLYAVVDSVRAAGCRDVLTMGDFNDVPSASEFNVLKALMRNLSAPLAERGEGSIRFNGKWNLIDMFWATAELADKASVSVLKIPFLMTRDNAMGGEKPLRTYLGSSYAGGVSDHCPILMEIGRGRQWIYDKNN